MKNPAPTDAPDLLAELKATLTLLEFAEERGTFKDCALPVVGKRAISHARNLIDGLENQ